MIGPTLTYPFIDSLRAKNWQFSKQTALGLLDESWKCGIPTRTNGISELKFSTDSKSLNILMKDISYLSNLPYIKYSDFNQNKVVLSNSENSKQIILWIAGITTPQDGRLLINLYDSKGVNVYTESLQVNNKISVGDFYKYEFNIENVAKLQLIAEPKNIIEWENIKIIAPIATKSSTISSPENVSQIWFNTYRGNQLFFPCQDSKLINDGTKPIPDYQFGVATNMGRDSIINSEADLLPISCLEMGNFNASELNCTYKLVMKGSDEWVTSNVQYYSRGLDIFI
jgi:hypothetical protein